MANRICPKCELNHIANSTDDLCAVCIKEASGSLGASKNMNATVVNFTFKRGPAPEHKRELRVQVGMPCILAFDKKDRCVGVVFLHGEKDVSAHGQAEIGFFEKYQSEYGQWHRIFVGPNGKDRLKYVQLEKDLDASEEYFYTAYLNFVKKD